MIDALTNLIGEYVQLAGDGIASLNWPWIFSAVLVVVFVWFTCKIILRIFDWGTHR